MWPCGLRCTLRKSAFLLLCLVGLPTATASPLDAIDADLTATYDQSLDAVILGWDGVDGATYEIWRNGERIANVTAPGFVDTVPQLVNHYLLLIHLPGGPIETDSAFMILDCEPINAYLVDYAPFFFVAIRDECVEGLLPV